MIITWTVHEQVCFQFGQYEQACGRVMIIPTSLTVHKPRWYILQHIHRDHVCIHIACLYVCLSCFCSLSCEMTERWALSTYITCLLCGHMLNCILRYMHTQEVYECSDDVSQFAASVQTNHFTHWNAEPTNPIWNMIHTPPLAFFSILGIYALIWHQSKHYLWPP